MGSWSQTVQKDQRAIIEGATVATSPESLITLPNSQGIFIGQQATYAPNINQQFTPEVAGTIADFLEYSVEIAREAWGNTAESIEGIFALAQAMQKEATAAREQAVEKEQGPIPVETKYILYAVVAIIGVMIWKKR